MSVQRAGLPVPVVGRARDETACALVPSLPAHQPAWPTTLLCRSWAPGQPSNLRLEGLLRLLARRELLRLHPDDTLAVTQEGWMYEGQPLPPTREYQQIAEQRRERAQALQQAWQRKQRLREHAGEVRRLQAQLHAAGGAASVPFTPLQQLVFAAVQRQPGGFTSVEALHSRLCGMWR